MHAVELTSVPTENRAVVVVHGLDLVLAPHLNSDLDWIQRTGVFKLRYPLVLSASIVLEYCAWTLSVNIANVLISSVSQIQRRIQGRGPGPPSFLDQTEAQRAEKNVLETAPLHISGSGCPPPPPLSQGLDAALKLARS